MVGWQPVIRIVVSPAEYHGLSAAAHAQGRSIPEFVKAAAALEMARTLPQLNGWEQRVVTANADAQELYEQVRANTWPPDDRPLSVRS